MQAQSICFLELAEQQEAYVAVVAAVLWPRFAPSTVLGGFCPVLRWGDIAAAGAVEERLRHCRG